MTDYHPAAVFVFEVEVCADCGEQLHPDADGNWDICGRCDSLAHTTVRFRVDRQHLLKQAKPELACIEGTVYFGTWQQAGHYYWLRGMRKAPGYGAAAYADLTPWGHHVDGGLFPRGAQPGQGVASVFHAHYGRDLDVMRILADHAVHVYALGLTQDGSPRHPLYMPGDVQPFVYGGR